uniref:Leishmanolysin-like peptidase n=1 Tax=Macrostomum lignano TaxID=282301 RepID=A0A1I8FSS1_9PLAT
MNFAALLLVLRSVEAVADCLHRLPRHSPASGSLGVDDGFKTGGFSAPSLATSIEGPELARRERDVVAIQSATTNTQITEPLRILVHYEPSLAAATDSESVTLRRLVEDSVLYWQSVLSVRHQSSAPPVAFWLPRPCKSNKVRVVRSPVNGAFLHYCADGCSSSAFCGHTSVPAAHLDLCRELTPAQDGGRLQHSGSRGAGFAGLITTPCTCPPTTLCAAAEAQYTARHELLHALGVTATLFAFMRQDNGVPRTPRNPATNMPALGLIEDDGVTLYQWGNDTVIQTKEPWRSARGVYNLTRHYVVTPRLVSLVRAHFNCPKMPGLPLENQGKLGSALTHWEKRLLESELMTAAYTGSSVVSEFTLAFLEDTGW